MLVVNSFDLWQKDAFFSAAEEVQQSADIMESAYRLWMRERAKGSTTEDVFELSRQLQVALGTAKWQLEEFEKAVRMAHGNRFDDGAASRHKQFIAAIGSQISCAEEALGEAFNKEGKQPLRWVNLDEEECDDLAMFLSGNSNMQIDLKDDCAECGHAARSLPTGSNYMSKDSNCNVNSTSSSSDRNCFDGNIIRTQNSESIIDIPEKQIHEIKDDVLSPIEKANGAQRTCSPTKIGSLKVVIADEDEERAELIQSIDSTPKDKGSKPFFSKQRCGVQSQLKEMINLFHQVGGIRRQLRTPVHPQFNCSIQVLLVLLLSIFIIVPFLVYST